MEERFICRPANHVIKEMTKRCNVTQRKDAETGQVVKRVNEYQTGSMFGWGAVDVTIPTLKKDLEDLRKDLAAIIDQIRPHQNLSKHRQEPEECDEIDQLFESPQQPAKSKRARSSTYNQDVNFERRVQHRVESAPVHHTSVSAASNHSAIGSLLQLWYEAWSKEHRIGNIGQVPEGFTGTDCPSLEQVRQSTAGKVVTHFCGFLKNLF